MVRIVAGSKKGIRLNTPENKSLRPTQDRVKEAIFSSLYDVNDLTVTDLFAGTGNLGLEALSRGAKSCVFVEKQFHHVNFIQQNIKKCEFEDESRIIKTDALSYLKKINGPTDLIFADPPYNYPNFDELVECFAQLPGKSKLILESAITFNISSKYIKLVRKEKTFGKTRVTMLELV